MLGEAAHTLPPLKDRLVLPTEFPHKEKDEGQTNIHSCLFARHCDGCFTNVISLNSPGQTTCPIFEIRRLRLRERNCIIQGQPVQEVGASRELGFLSAGLEL